MFRALAVIAAFALLVYALADFATSDERDRGGIPGWLWVVIIIVLPYFGPIAWIAFSRSRRGQAVLPGAPSAGNGPKARRRPSGPVAPDDDPEFLWRLAREQQRQGRPATPGTPGTPDGPPAPRTDGQTPSQQDAAGHAPREQGPHGPTPGGTSSHEPTSRDQTPRSGAHDDPDAAPEG